MLVALAEMCLAGRTGASLSTGPSDIPAHAWLFGEDQGRYLVATSAGTTLVEKARQAGVPAILIGRSGGKSIRIADIGETATEDLRRIHEGWMPAYMA